MKASTLYRISGIAVVIGGICGIIAYMNHPEGDPSANLAQYAVDTHFAHLWLYFAGLLTTMGLPALFVRQRARMGVIGLVSTLTLVLTITLTEMTHSFIELAFVPAVAQAHVSDPGALIQAAYSDPLFGLFGMVFTLLAVLAFIGFAVTSLRSRTLPRVSLVGAVGMIVFAIITLVGVALPDVSLLPDSLYGSLMYASFGCYGLALVLDRGTVEEMVTTPEMQPATAITANA